MGIYITSLLRPIFKASSAVLIALAMTSSSMAADSTAIVAALRISGVVTGGLMPTNSTEFNSMVASITTGDYYGAALTAVQSQYGANYLLRRLAFQMQNAGYTASTVTDNDATAFLIAHFAGAGGATASISKLWSDNMTCLVKNSTGAMVHVGDLTPTELNTIDWRSALSCSAGQMAIDASTANIMNVTPTKITIPAKHVGGYVTLSDRIKDNSLAEIGASAGTNLRYIENIWMVATGMDLLSFASTEARPQNVPRFVPENDAHFLVGNGQTACIACHGGGLAALNHGYATLADLFDFDPNVGLTYNTAPTIGTMKSLGSNPNKRQDTLNCTKANVICNADSSGAAPDQSWELASTWGARGTLTQLGWNAPTSGQGLNSLGAAIGKAGIVYTNFVKRVIREVCPLGAVSAPDLAQINSIAQTSDDIKLVIAKVASNVACR